MSMRILSKSFMRLQSSSILSLRQYSGNYFLPYLHIIYTPQQSLLIQQPNLNANRNIKKFTPSHEWISVENGVGTVGITDHAQSALGDVVYVELPEVGLEVEVEGQVGAVESVKAASDLYSPVSGTIVEANSALADKPKLINKSPETDAWLFKIKLNDETELDTLLDAAKYNELIGEEA
ncbi:Glycine cleavage system H protein [Smittium culicis]|uniref:Glycine cleavage system H protein n=1 Tax=Smittium culicis TaxID=133412 RepID=A0A1R1XKS5_9FUNG|nr:Glycine cleavage system H protein [Smittium culicis]